MENNDFVAYIFLNGVYEYDKKWLLQYINQTSNYIICCADGGANYTYEYGITPNIIIGDLDSIVPEILEKYKQNNDIIFQIYPSEKDESDFELILLYLRQLQKKEHKKIVKTVVFGALGGRIDFMLNNLYLLEDYPNIIIQTPSEKIFYQDKDFVLENKQGQLISFISLDPNIYEITLVGFKYPLDKRNAPRNSSLLMSNVIIDSIAYVSFSSAKLLVILSNK